MRREASWLQRTTSWAHGSNLAKGKDLEGWSEDRESQADDDSAKYFASHETRQTS